MLELVPLVAWYQAELDSLDRVQAAELAAERFQAAAAAVAGADTGRSRGWLLSGLLAAGRRLKYAAARVRSLSRDLNPRIMRCGVLDRWVRCRCDDGAARAVPVGCRQRACCATCRRRWSSRTRRRMLAAAAGHLRPGGRVWMLTLSVQHSGDLVRDRARLVRGWTGLRKQLHRWWGAFPFVLVWETTPGTDGAGHEHAHVVLLNGPGYWPYAALHRVWRSVCPWSKQLNVARPSRRRDPVKAAAHYVCKYVSKGADIGGAGWTDELVAQVIAAHYNKRSITTSHRFWQVEQSICKHCNEPCRIAPRPSDWERLIDTREGMLVCWRIRGERAGPGP